MKEVTIYTDGACSGNPGKGGYGVVMMYNGHRKELSEGFRKTTNNRMELLAVIAALRALKESCKVMLYSDSQYVINGIVKGWAVKWRKNNWIKSDKKKAINTDLWGELLDLLEKHDVKFIWVKGHADNVENERCDRLAVAAAAGKKLLADTIYEKGE
ncbi:MAG: ribonuclease HI [Firmicutes bacterium]|nr:ribonuclease HI [Bacillota bacterium]